MDFPRVCLGAHMPVYGLGLEVYGSLRYYIPKIGSFFLVLYALKF